MDVMAVVGIGLFGGLVVAWLALVTAGSFRRHPLELSPDHPPVSGEGRHGSWVRRLLAHPPSGHSDESLAGLKESRPDGH